MVRKLGKSERKSPTNSIWGREGGTEISDYTHICTNSGGEISLGRVPTLQTLATSHLRPCAVFSRAPMTKTLVRQSQ